MCSLPKPILLHRALPLLLLTIYLALSPTLHDQCHVQHLTTQREVAARGAPRQNVWEKEQIAAGGAATAANTSKSNI